MRSPPFIFYLLSLLLLLTAHTTLACKCFIVGTPNHDPEVTKNCCRVARGKGDGNDCNAHSMSGRLARFSTCCKGFDRKTDCGCPIGC